MRQEAYCSFEVARLLEEKGFNEVVHAYHNIYDKVNLDFNVSVDAPHLQIPCPTHQMAMQWLRDERNILITVLPDKIHNTIALFWNVYIVTEKEYKWIFAGGGVNMTYEELIEEALLYVLKILIN